MESMAPTFAFEFFNDKNNSHIPVLAHFWSEK